MLDLSENWSLELQKITVNSKRSGVIIVPLAIVKALYLPDLMFYWI